VERLEDSRGPCAQVLSVSELLTILRLFPLGKGLFPEGRKASLPPLHALPLHQPEQNCHTACAPTFKYTLRSEVHTLGGRRGTPTRVVEKAYIPRVGIHLHTQGGIYPTSEPLWEAYIPPQNSSGSNTHPPHHPEVYPPTTLRYILPTLRYILGVTLSHPGLYPGCNTLSPWATP